MTADDRAALRALAGDALDGGWHELPDGTTGYGVPDASLDAFLDAATPTTVLALLDRLDAMETAWARLHGQSVEELT